jgi:seryl-tRNA synthetase
MKRFLSLIGLAILVPLTLFALGAKDRSSKSIQVELKSLRSEVASLEKRVERLENQLQQVSKVIKNYSVTIPQTFPRMPQVPKGWRKREFNGIPYYVIPLQQIPKKSPQRTRDNAPR